MSGSSVIARRLKADVAIRIPGSAEKRIATTSVRTGLAMTEFVRF